MMKNFWLLCILFTSNLSFACICVERTPTELASNAVIIFAGTAIKSEFITGQGTRTTFEVIRKFKGDVNFIEVIWSRVPGCGVNYSIGQSHVVLANEQKEVSACTGYDEFYPTKYDNSPRMEVNFRGILKELRKNDKQN